MNKIIFLSVIIIFMSGCAHWVKSGAGQAQFNRESSDCENYAYQQAPVRTVAAITANDYFAAAAVRGDPKPSYVDENKDARVAAYKSCMFSKGWSVQQEN